MLCEVGLDPLAGEDVGPLVCDRVRVRGDICAGGELAQHDESTSRFVLVEDLQLNSGVRAGLPRFIGGLREVLEHGEMAAGSRQFGKLARTRNSLQQPSQRDPSMEKRRREERHPSRLALCKLVNYFAAAWALATSAQFTTLQKAFR